MKTFHLTIASLDKSVFDGLVHSVSVPGTEGVMTILAHHAPVISRLKPGSIRYTTEDAIEHVHVSTSDGTLEVSERGCTILV